MYLQVGFKIDYSSAASRRKKLDETIATGVASKEPRTVNVNTKYSSTEPPDSNRLDSFMKDLFNAGDRAVLLSTTEQYSQHFVDKIKPVTLPNSLTKLRDSSCDDYNDAELSKVCESKKDRVMISAEEAEKIERETRQQHRSACWFSLRAGRVTASQMQSVCAFRREKPAMTTIRSVCYPENKKPNEAMAWGIQKESQAVHDYTEHSKLEHVSLRVQESGFVINPDIPYMGASPDGVVSCDCCGKGVLEVKCPFKHRNNTIAEACEDKEFCLKKDVNNIFLDKKHKYYYQIQTQLLVSNADYCDFVVWTLKDMLVLRIEPDVERFEEFKTKAKDFFLNIVLPELIAKKYTSQLTKASSIKSSCSVSKKKPEKQKKKKSKELWCYCKRDEDYDDMVGCDNDDCEIQWYHIGCVGLECLPSREESWYCRQCLE